MRGIGLKIRKISKLEEYLGTGAGEAQSRGAGEDYPPLRGFVLKIRRIRKKKNLENKKNKHTWGEEPGRPTPEGPWRPTPPLRGFGLKIRKIEKLKE